MRAYETFWFLSEDERARIVSPSSSTSATSWGNGFRASFLPPNVDLPAGYGKQNPAPQLPKVKNPAHNDKGVNPSWISLLLALLCMSLERLGYWDAKVGD